MKREILFRGARVCDGHFVNGSLVEVNGECDSNESVPHIVISYGPDTFDWFEVVPETVGQFTGIMDKSGEELFEGDIYNMGDDNIRYVVVWRNCMFMGKQIGSNSYAGLDYFESDIKKVGNIYDNPELLNR